jgi:hypothetical protein
VRPVTTARRDVNPLTLDPAPTYCRGMANAVTNDPRSKHESDGFPDQSQDQPGLTDEMRKEPDHGEDSYQGSGRLSGRRALITGGDSGIGRAVAIAFAREGADVAIVHLPEEQTDAEETLRWVSDAGVKAVDLAGDLRDEDFCAAIVDKTVAELGGLDIVVLNAAYQKDRESIASLETGELDRVFRTNLYAPGLRSSRPRGGTRSASSPSARTPRSDAPDSRPSSPAPMSTWRAMQRHTSRVRSCPSLAERVFDPEGRMRRCLLGVDRT